jgi:hypothetical protein
MWKCGIMGIGILRIYNTASSDEEIHLPKAPL